MSAVIPVRRRRGNWFADRPIAVMILSMIAFSASAGVLLCVVAVGRIGGLDDRQRDMYENSVVAFSDLDAIQAAYEDIRQGYTAYYLADPPTRTGLEDQLAGRRADLEELIEAYAGTTQHTDRFATLTDDIAAFFALGNGRLVTALQAGDVGAADAVAAGPMVEVHGAVTKNFTGLRTVLRAEADDRARAGGDDASSARLLLWSVLAVSVGIGLVPGLHVVRKMVRIDRPVQRSVDALAAGDVTVRPSGTSKVEPGGTAESLAPAQESLPSVFGERWASSTQASAEELSRTVQTVATGADPAGASHPETASNPPQARQPAPRTVAAAEPTTAGVTEQTDLLALDATMEAARAGDAGPGRHHRRRGGADRHRRDIALGPGGGQRDDGDRQHRLRRLHRCPVPHPGADPDADRSGRTLPNGHGPARHPRGGHLPRPRPG